MPLSPPLLEDDIIFLACDASLCLLLLNVHYLENLTAQVAHCVCAKFGVLAGTWMGTGIK